MNTRKLAIGLLSLCLLATGCKAGGSGSEGGSATLTIAVSDSPDNLDPASAFIGWSTSREGITETLVGVDEKLNVEPKLALSWNTTDAITWEIVLREGVKFHNGTPMDAAAVKASLEHSLATNVRAKSQFPMKSIEGTGTKLTIVTTRPLAALPHILTDPMMSIQALGAGINPATCPIGTGPFKVSEYIPKQKRVLSAHQDYWDGAPKLSTIKIKEYTDSQAMSMALQTGEVDVVVRPDATSLPNYSDTSRFTTWKTTSTRSDGVILNTKRDVFRDVRARQAINYAVDRQGYASLMHDTAKPTFVFFPENVVFGGEAGRTTTVTQKDLGKTKSLFLELGYTEENGVLVKDGNPLTLKVVTYPMRPYLGQLAQLLQSDMRSIGVTIKIEEMKSTADIMKAGDYDLGMYSMGTAPSGDPEYFFDTMLRSTSPTNYCHYASATFDAALDKLSNTINHDERVKASHAAEQVLLDELPYIIVGHQQWWAVSHASVKNLEIRPSEYHLISAKTSVQK